MIFRSHPITYFVFSFISFIEHTQYKAGNEFTDYYTGALL